MNTHIVLSLGDLILLAFLVLFIAVMFGHYVAYKFKRLFVSLDEKWKTL